VTVPVALHRGRAIREHAHVREQAIDVVAHEICLSGTVGSPDRNSETPAVVLVSGSGPMDRSDGGYSMRFATEAEARRIGIFGHSEGGWVALRACVGDTKLAAADRGGAQIAERVKLSLA
jgi:hypothetical protein